MMMSAAGQRDDRCLAAPDTMKGAALSKVSAKLIKLGFVREIRAKAPLRRLCHAGVSLLTLYKHGSREG
jgi:hypothetical protein